MGASQSQPIFTLGRITALAVALLMAFAVAAPAKALDIHVSNNVKTLDAGAFEAVDGWYTGELAVAWSGNATNTADLTWSGNAGEVRVAPYDIEDNQQRAGTLAVSIEQTAEEQDVVFTVTKVNGKTLDVTVDVPALYQGPIAYHALRTSINPGYYYSGALIDLGVTLTADSVDEDSFSARPV